MGDVVQLFPDDKESAIKFWDQFAHLYVDPKNSQFRRVFNQPEYDREREKLFAVHPELREFPVEED